jgi:RHS repeat-associated protein
MNRLGFISKEQDRESRLADHGVRKYDYDIGRFTSTDLLFEKYPGWSPYQYSLNNPINLLDWNGKSFFKFGKDNDDGDYEIKDGSNAVYKLSGKKEFQHFVFSGFDESKDGKNEINLTTAIQEGQNLNQKNEFLKPHTKVTEDGVVTETHCNYATQNILKTIESTGITEIDLTGNANSMNKKINNSDIFQAVDKNTAIQNAASGGLSIFSITGKKNGHIGTFSVGDNIKKGIYANIGSNPNNEYVNSIGPRNFQFFILILRK